MAAIRRSPKALRLHVSSAQLPSFKASFFTAPSFKAPSFKASFFTASFFAVSIFTASIFAVTLLTARSASAEEETKIDKGQLDFFESKIRPVLVAKCYSCHSAKAESDSKLKGGLLLDTRIGMQKGGESGPAVVPGNVKESLIISALKHEEFEMPPKGKLPEDVVADFVKWVETGAADPREGEPLVTRKEIDFDSASQFWAFQS
ncbi:MAG: hypothetical protein ACI9G1_005267, partial [Pirellulaceae bacterium]